MLNQINTVREEINKIYEDDVEKQVKFTKQRFYETGPRAMKVLAWRLCKQKSKNIVKIIKKIQLQEK